MTTRFLRFACLLAVTATLSACFRGPMAVDALPPNASDSTVALATMKDDMDGLNSTPFLNAEIATVPAFKGLGMAQISKQPGGSINEKRLLAIRAARLEALRDLTEQVHGIALTSETTLRDTIVQNDSLRGLVEGEIRGAKTERITPKGSDSYEVVMTLDPDVVAYITRFARFGV